MIKRLIYNNKKAIKKTHQFAQIEANMLLYLSKYLKVPKVYEYNQNYLIMEYIEPNSPINEIEAALILANLHKQTASYFGFEYNTTIGPYKQINTKTYDWIEFFTKYRIFYIAKNILDTATFKKLEKLALNLDRYIPKNPTSSLLHGDIWAGNVISSNNKIYFIDPAIYFGDREVELSFIMMFNTFSEKFFGAYNEVYPIEKEFFEYRYKIYQIYPYLVHIKSYGSSYLSGLRSILDYFI